MIQTKITVGQGSPGLYLGRSGENEARQIIFDFTAWAEEYGDGIITSSTKTLHFTIPVAKSLANISSVTVTAFTGGARGVSGYVGGSSDSYNWLGQGFTVTAAKRSDSLVEIMITNSAGFTNVSNNTPVNILANTVGLKFA